MKDYRTTHLEIQQFLGSEVAAGNIESYALTSDPRGLEVRITKDGREFALEMPVGGTIKLFWQQYEAINAQKGF